MARSITAEVKPEVFKWLRESSGWALEDVGKRLKISAENVKEFEEGERSPTLRQLKDLSQAFKRPLAAFFLSKPKEEPALPKDYRMLPNREGIFDKKTILAIRKARNLQDIGKELSSNIKYETKPKVKRINIFDNPEAAGKKYREIFRLTEEKQRKFKDSYKLFSYIRDALEDMNILVFQISMPIEDARGFALADNSPAIIVVSTKDSVEARLFSLMHEFGHILLGETIIDIPDISITTKNKVENWCNEFASSFLLPKETAKRIFEAEHENLTVGKTLNSLARRYKVSKAMLLLNMYKLNFISKTIYQSILDRYKPEDVAVKKKEGKKGGGIPSDKRCLSEVGNKFISLVANNFDRKYITYSDALNYLSIKSKNFDKVLARAVK